MKYWEEYARKKADEIYEQLKEFAATGECLLMNCVNCPFHNKPQCNTYSVNQTKRALNKEVEKCWYSH